MLGARPGPSPVLSIEAEERLLRYLVEVSDMGFGLSHQEVMVLAFQIAEKAGIKVTMDNYCNTS